MLALLFNMALHYFYGNSISFLYICHFNFLIILLLAYMISKLGIDIFKSKVSYIITIMILIIHSIAKIINLYIVLCPAYTKVEHFSLLPIIIIFLTVSCIVLLVFKKGIIKILSVIICAVLLGVFYYNINYSKNIVCEINCEYEQKLELYKDQLKDMKNEYNVKSYIDREEKAQVMFFGMADRKKIIYKEGKLIDAKTQEVIKQFDYDKEVIIPNLYTVLLKKDDIEIVIEENEDGVFYIQNGKKETITTGKNKINLPDFEGKKYSEVLKVLHQEILFNIDGNEPKPNIFGYEQAYYRDATVVTKVLEKTNNTGLILEWVNNLEKIYDNSRSPSINEADNLGELLYIIGATKSSNKELMKKIIKEINSKKDENGFISGMVDGSIQTYYPTLLAIYGAEKNGIELDLKYPIIDDGYARLTWYSDYKVATMNSQTSSYYPYINWGFYHYSPWGDLFILDELYPLSYEGGEDDPNTKVENECFISKFYCEKDLYISHSWTASEIFLLIDEEA